MHYSNPTTKLIMYFFHDSVSVNIQKCSQNTTAYLGAQPRTPNSYNSETASSGDAADASLNDDSSTCASSLFDEWSHKAGTISDAADSKNSLLKSML